MHITLYADYADWPLWGPSGLLREDDLPLSASTKHRIKAWFNAYDSSPRPDWPLWRPPPASATEEETEEDAWVAEGARLRDVIARELGPGFDVVFET